MARPAIIWRNPRFVERRRLWSQARHDSKGTLYVVVRSAGGDSEWEGLPNLEVIEGGQAARPRQSNRIAEHIAEPNHGTARS